MSGNGNCKSCARALTDSSQLVTNYGVKPPKFRVTAYFVSVHRCRRSESHYVHLPTAIRAGDYSPSVSGALIAVRFGACERLP